MLKTMTKGVFGTPIDEKTLREMPEYKHKIIRRSDMAKVARDRMSAEGKDTDCRKYVENLSRSFGPPKALCTFYNATGGDLTFILSHDWHGDIANSPCPMLIKNGQWGGFLQAHPIGLPIGLAGTQPIGLAGAVVYHGHNNEVVPMNWLLSWSILPSTLACGSNMVLTEICEDGYFKVDRWGDIYDKVVNASGTSSVTKNGCTSTMSIGTGNAPFCTAIMSLTGPEPLK